MTWWSLGVLGTAVICDAETLDSDPPSERDELVVKLVRPSCELKVGDVITATLFWDT